MSSTTDSNRRSAVQIRADLQQLRTGMAFDVDVNRLLRDIEPLLAEIERLTRELDEIASTASEVYCVNDFTEDDVWRLAGNTIECALAPDLAARLIEHLAEQLQLLTPDREQEDIELRNLPTPNDWIVGPGQLDPIAVFSTRRWKTKPRLHEHVLINRVEYEITGIDTYVVGVDNDDYWSHPVPAGLMLRRIPNDP